MFCVTIIEDEKNYSDRLREYIDRYAGATGENFEVRLYSDPFTFLDNYKKTDIIFMDIMMPGMDGMETSKRLRRMDADVVLIFVTNMSKYAIKGYEVDAFDFVVKPVYYEDLKIRLDRAIAKLKNKPEQKLLVSTGSSTLVLRAEDVRYIEIFSHKLTYHTTGGDVTAYGSLKKLTAELPEGQFLKVNKSFIVNLKYVTMIEDFDIYLGKDAIPIAQKKKREIEAALTKFFTEGKR